MAIEPGLAKSLSEKPNQELIAILEKPEDWRPEVVEFARCELGRRSIPTAEIHEQLAASAHQKAGEPLTFRETVGSALSGGVLGPLGLFLLSPQAARFKSEGFALKSAKLWRIYWQAVGFWTLAILVGMAFAFSVHNSSSHRPDRGGMTATAMEQKARAYLEPKLHLGDTTTDLIVRFGDPAYQYETGLHELAMYFEFPISDQAAAASGVGGFTGFFTNNQLAHWDPIYRSYTVPDKGRPWSP